MKKKSTNSILKAAVAHFWFVAILTEWIEWFLACMERSLQNSEKILSSVLKKAKFWENNAHQTFSERQRKVINRLLDGFEGNMTSSRWANIGKCSQDSAARDIQDLIKRKILKKNPGGGRPESDRKTFSKSQ